MRQRHTFYRLRATHRSMNAATLWTERSTRWIIRFLLPDEKKSEDKSFAASHLYERAHSVYTAFNFRMERGNAQNNSNNRNELSLVLL